MKPDKTRIDSYEYFVLGDSNNLKMTQMLKVTVSRYISISGSFRSGPSCKEMLPLSLTLKIWVPPFVAIMC